MFKNSFLFLFTSLLPRTFLVPLNHGLVFSFFLVSNFVLFLFTWPVFIVFWPLYILYLSNFFRGTAALFSFTVFPFDLLTGSAVFGFQSIALVYCLLSKSGCWCGCSILICFRFNILSILFFIFSSHYISMASLFFTTSELQSFCVTLYPVFIFFSLLITSSCTSLSATFPWNNLVELCFPPLHFHFSCVFDCSFLDFTSCHSPSISALNWSFKGKVGWCCWNIGTKWFTTNSFLLSSHPFMLLHIIRTTPLPSAFLGWNVFW